MSIICDLCAKAGTCGREPYLGAWYAEWVYDEDTNHKKENGK